MGNLSKKDIDRLFKGTDPFVKEILQIWSEAFYEENIRSYAHLISSPLQHNSLIRIANSPVFYTEWLLKGVTIVKHLMDDSSNFLSLTAFQNKNDLSVRPLTFYRIISAIKFLHRQNAMNQSETNYECSLSTFLESEKSSRLLCKKLVSKKSEQPSNCHQKWFNEINLAPDQTINWKAAYQLSFQYTKSSKLIVFNFKFLHRRISTNSFLQKLGLVDSGKCTFCQNETEKLLHLFWECKKTQSFWNVSLRGYSRAKWKQMTSHHMSLLLWVWGRTHPNINYKLTFLF